MPPFLFEFPTGVFYGMPDLPPWGVKVADHAGGPLLDRPEDVCRDIDPTELQSIRQFLADTLPQLSGPPTHHATCFYTMTPDEHFVVDRLHRDARIAFAAGLSGHGFKFTPVLGQALADLTTEGKTELPIGFLSVERFGSS